MSLNNNIKDFIDSFGGNYGWQDMNQELVDKFTEVMTSLGDIDDDSRFDLIVIGFQIALSMSASRDEFKDLFDDYFDMTWPVKY